MEKILKADPSLGFHMDGFWVWCGSVLKWKDGYHMFASRWSKKKPMFEGYIFTSEIVHAFSPDPLGPYTCRETVLPTGNPRDWNGRMAHNPTVLRYGDRILLYYIASTGNSCRERSIAESGSDWRSRIRPRARGPICRDPFWNRFRAHGIPWS